MLERINALKEKALGELKEVVDQDSLREWRVKYLGRSAELGEILQGLKDLDKDQRPLVGREVNQAKTSLEVAFEARQEEMRIAELDRSLREDKLDVTLPGRPVTHGRLHPATQTLRRIYAIWAEMGFQVYRSREVETDEYNFELLNIPAHHPARDMWDTFHTSGEGIVLRTHTSPG